MPPKRRKSASGTPLSVKLPSTCTAKTITKKPEPESSENSDDEGENESDNGAEEDSSESDTEHDSAEIVSNTTGSSAVTSLTAKELFIGKAKKNPFIWFKTPNEFTDLLPYSNGSSKLKPIVSNVENVTQFFSHIICDDIISTITSYTNKKLDVKSQISIIEMKTFVGLLVLFGITKKRNTAINEIWNSQSIHFSNWAQVAMPRNRFQLIYTHICFSDIDNQHSKQAKFGKINDVFWKFKSNLSVLEPGENLCVDETLYSFRGRCSFKQYMPKKPSKYGLKFWCLVDVDTNYLLDTNIYLGKTNTNDTKEKDVGSKVVMSLVEKYANTNRVVYADNFFVSISLANKLWSQGLKLVGTIRSNKAEVPSSFLANKDREINSSLFAYKNQLTLVSFVPKLNKSVLLLSTKHHHEEHDLDYRKPVIICDYNHGKGGVDIFDFMITNSSCRRRTLRWTLSVFFFMLDVAVHNACTLEILRLRKAGKLETNESRARGQLKSELALSLINLNAKERLETIASKDYKYVPRSLMKSFNDVGLGKKRKERESDELSTSSPKRKRCYLCTNHNFTKHICKSCFQHVCGKHSETKMTSVCTNCQGE